MIAVTITGCQDSSADYDDQRWLAADATVRQAITEFYESGASIGNIAEAVQGALDDAEAAV